jgi:aryl-alcohol dehydrogenase-like predicted oxidoreductase
LTLFDRFDRYSNDEAVRATGEYCAIARRHGLDPAQMALAFVTSRPFVTSNIIGATTLEQLDSNLGSVELDLTDEVLGEIEAVHIRQPNPSP